MKKVLHISTECYPAAKAGGMGDVVGALPIYQNKVGLKASVIIPHYHNKWITSKSFETIHQGRFKMGNRMISFKINELKKDNLGFDFYTVSINGLFDRPSIYLADDGEAFPDEVDRNIGFQRAVLEWLLRLDNGYHLLHCHDHMTGLIPFMLLHCKRYNKLKEMPTFLTIHNGQYRGIFDWDYARYIPKYDRDIGGLLDWDGTIHSLASAMKCAWRISTVSPSYMGELQSDFDTLTSLAQKEKYKSIGILNGIDAEVWDPSSDPMLAVNLNKSIPAYKNGNRKALASAYGFNSKRPLVSFIGRFAYEKGADLLAGAFSSYLKESKGLQFFILGSGAKDIEADVMDIAEKYDANVTAVIAYDESLAHNIYASSDFIMMPSRFEPCGLNQMYAMRYGTVPIVRKTGGLKDTVPDIGDGGNGINFLNADEADITYSLRRCESLYKDQKSFKELRKKIMKLDFGWQKSASVYKKEYQKVWA